MSGSPHAVASAPRAKSAGQARSRAGADEPPPAHPFPISTMSKSALLSGRIVRTTAYKTDLRKALAPGQTFGPTEIAGYMWRPCPVSNAFAKFFAVC